MTGKRKSLNGGLTETPSIISTAVWAKEARIIPEEAAAYLKTEVGFEDTNLTFDQDLEYLGVVVADLKRPPKQLVLLAWLSNKEQKWQKKKDVVNEGKLLKEFLAN